MLSGNGRHRRPRQAPALLVAAGVTGSAIAIPLLGATGASAATGTTWDRVAECESGGAWSENSGNGHFGGLQLTQEDWEKYGGLEYAASADLASRSQQIAVAERILADQGVGAWPTCGLLAGLDDDAASVAVDTGVAGDGSSGTSSDASGSSGSSGSSESSESSDSSGLSGILESSPTSPSASSPESDTSSTAADESANSDTSSPSGDDGSDSSASDAQESDSSLTATPEGGDPDNSGQSDGSSALTDTGETGTGRHRGTSADEDAADGRRAESSGRHASRGDAASREAIDGSYTVRPGDSLWSIADSLDLSGGWRALYAGNEQAVGADPNLIIPGQKLDVGVEQGAK